MRIAYMFCCRIQRFPERYWPKRNSNIVESDFVRFTNGGRQTWVRNGEGFVGPLFSPSRVSEAAVEMQAAFEAKYQRDWNDPAGDELKAIWADAWAAAKATA